MDNITYVTSVLLHVKKHAVRVMFQLATLQFNNNAAHLLKHNVYIDFLHDFFFASYHVSSHQLFTVYLYLLFFKVIVLNESTGEIYLNHLTERMLISS